MFQVICCHYVGRTVITFYFLRLTSVVEYQHTPFEEQRCGSEISVLTGEILTSNLTHKTGKAPVRCGGMYMKALLHL
jgi:hypothetical protein